jgi:D-alanyl-D-alanine carboxypeptidase
MICLIPGTVCQAVEPPTNLQVIVKKQMQDYMNNLRKENQIRGLSAAAVLPNGEVITAVSGYSDAEKQIAITDKTLLLGGSTGKTFVAATMMTLLSEGRVNIDAKISTWLGQEPWFDRLPNGTEITLRMLMNHTSGIINNYDKFTFQLGIVWNLLWDEDFYYTPEEVVGYILDSEPLWPAGSGFNYSDVNYVLTGLIIEKITGNDYYAELKERVLDPLSLSEIVPSNKRSISGLSPGYLDDEMLFYLTGMSGKNTDENGLLKLNPAIEWCGGGLATTPASLAVFYKKLLEGKLLEQQYIDMMTAPPPGSHYGFALNVNQSETNGTLISHGGWFPGYRTLAVYFKRYGVSIAIQSNQDFGIDDHFQKFAGSVIDKYIEATGD